jgi:hypothetical protein
MAACRPRLSAVAVLVLRAAGAFMVVSNQACFLWHPNLANWVLGKKLKRRFV